MTPPAEPRTAAGRSLLNESRYAYSEESLMHPVSVEKAILTIEAEAAALHAAGWTLSRRSERDAQVALADEARLVSQWHDAVDPMPDELRAELRDLGDKARAAIKGGRG